MAEPETKTDILFKNPVMCFFQIPHEHVKTVLKKLEFYSDGGNYLLSLEVSKNTHKETKGEHIHILYDDVNDRYHCFAKCLRDIWHLRGRAIDGMPKQYGKVKNIKDIEKACAYTMKDGKYYTNIDDLDKLNEWISLSYEKNPKREIYEEWLEYMNETIEIPEFVGVHGTVETEFVNSIRYETIKFYINNQYTLPTKSGFFTQLCAFLSQNEKLDLNDKIFIINNLY